MNNFFSFSRVVNIINNFCSFYIVGAAGLILEMMCNQYFIKWNVKPLKNQMGSRPNTFNTFFCKFNQQQIQKLHFFR